MKRSKLIKLDLLSFPDKIDIACLSGGRTDYAYASEIVCVDSIDTLIIDFYSLKDKNTEFRIFVVDEDFITLFLSPPKWSDLCVNGLFTYGRHFSGCITADKQNDLTIFSFLNNKIQGGAEQNALDCLSKYQLLIRKKSLMKKHQKIRDRIDNAFSMMEPVPYDIYQWIEENPLWYHQYIFYHREKQKIIGYCSACKADVMLSNAKHNTEGICPVCGRQVLLKSDGISFCTCDRFVFSLMQKGQGNSVIERVFEGFKSYRNGYKTPTTSYNERRRYVYHDDRVYAYHYGRFKNTDEVRWCEGMQPSFAYVTYTDTGCLYFSNLRAVLMGTRWIDSGIGIFASTKYPFDTSRYLGLYKNHNDIRFLIDNKLFSLVVEALDRSWQADKITVDFMKIVKACKGYFPLFREIGISIDEIVMIGMCIGRPLKKDVLLRIRSLDLVSDMPRILKYASAEKAVNYVEKNIPPDNKRNARNVLIIWLDYLNMAEEAGYDMSSSFVLFPRQLQREHDRFQTERIAAQNLAYDESIREMFVEVSQKVSFSDDDFFIRPPVNAAEICGEAVELRHCVDRYIKQVALNQTMILFLRRKEEPQKPFYTVELCNNEVRQCRGLCNVDATEIVKAFVDKWKENKLSLTI